MRLERHTASLCNTCYKPIPAVVHVLPTGVTLSKQCSVHGAQTGLVERDPVFYTWVQGLQCPSIYPGYFVDVTRTCQLRCSWCYYALEQKDPAGVYTIGNIVDECAAHRKLAPFILTGGEPTFRDDIVQLVTEVTKVGPTEIVTNGVRLADSAELFESMMQLLGRIVDGRWLANINLSIHDKETEKWKAVLERCRQDKVMIESALIVIDSKERFKWAVETALANADVVQSFRIKAASRIWNEQKPDKTFVSDMLNWLDEIGGPGSWKIVQDRQNKSVFVNVLFKGVLLMLVSWHDTSNVDLDDIDCPPYYRTRNGAIENMVTAMLINEGMQRGWIGGRKLG